MNINVIFKEKSINIVDIDINGSDMYITYVDKDGNLTKDLVYGKGEIVQIATNAKIIE
ncbi:MAG: hypothetical protein ACTSXY_15155 [Promethearchaeota archaeon]